MRLDKYLWFARFTKSRGLAQVLAEEGRIRLDGRPVARAATPVRPGSVLTFALNGRVRVIRIKTLPKRRGPAAEAADCYSELVDAAPRAT